MLCASRPMSSGTTWSRRYDATASSRPLSVPSPRPVSPSSVVTFRVTKFRSGLDTMTSAATIFTKDLSAVGCSGLAERGTGAQPVEQGQLGTARQALPVAVAAHRERTEDSASPHGLRGRQVVEQAGQQAG